MLLLRFLLIVSLGLITGCPSFLGGNLSSREPLDMKSKISKESLALMNDAFNVGSPIVDQHLHILGDKKPIQEITQQLKYENSDRRICPSISFDDIPDTHDSNPVAWINDERFDPPFSWKGIKLIKLWYFTKVLMNTVRISDRENSDMDSIIRLFNLVKSISDGDPSYGFQVHILAVDGNYDHDTGAFMPTKTDMVIPNWYVIKLTECLNEGIENGDPFVPVISINPYKNNAATELAELKETNKDLRYIKWVAPAMGFNPDKNSKKMDDFYKQVVKSKMVIISHTGGEHAFHVKDPEYRQFGDPRLMRKALNLGIPVILSHAGGDKNHKEGALENHNYFIDMIKDETDENGWCLFGDISALTLHKNFQHFKVLLDKDSNRVKYRMLYGSDYPLPAVSAMYPGNSLVRKGYLFDENRIKTNELRLRLREIFRYNPLTFDVVVKRNISIPMGKAKEYRSKPLPVEVFMSLEENIKQEMEDTSHQLKRKKCHDWYNKLDKK